MCCCLANSSPTTTSKPAEQPQDQDLTDQLEQITVNNIRIKALHTLRRSLETYGDLTANRLMLHMAKQGDDRQHAQNEEAHTSRDSDAANSSSESQDEVLSTVPSTTAANVGPAQKPLDTNGTSSFEVEGAGVLRVRVGLKQTHWQKEDPKSDESVNSNVIDKDQQPSPSFSTVLTTADELEASSSTRRQLRSAASRRQHGENSAMWSASNHHSHHQRRRRKGCPPLHGKDQLLCPSRNTHRYDVCVTREQLCNHVRDCPDGEDEDPRHCFFYKPLDDQLKTLSHAVLLLVDSVMKKRRQAVARRWKKTGANSDKREKASEKRRKQEPLRRSASVQSKDRTFTGNHMRKLLTGDGPKQISEALPDVQLRPTLEKLLCLLGKIQYFAKASFLQLGEISEFGNLVDEYVACLKEKLPAVTITPKCHLLFVHVRNFISAACYGQ
uniref:Uncharacterized protein n=1 Tax=Ditylenchus dipsaci TaxID=166011 RepID=A0A915EGH5_9BILA